MPVFTNILVAAALSAVFAPFVASASTQQTALPTPDRTLARDVFQQLIETNTSHSVGSTTVAADAMRKRLLDAGSIVSFIRLKREGFVPDRDIILALTAGEEGGEGNGVDWLLKNHRDMIDAGFALN